MTDYFGDDFDFYTGFEFIYFVLGLVLEDQYTNIQDDNNLFEKEYNESVFYRIIELSNIHLIKFIILLIPCLITLFIIYLMFIYSINLNCNCRNLMNVKEIINKYIYLYLIIIIIDIIPYIFIYPYITQYTSVLCMPIHWNTGQYLLMMSIFYKIKCEDFSTLITSDYKNKAFNLDYKELFKKKEFKDVSCVYIDTPYTGEQYSRFYHVLETVTKYDNPKLEFKAKYRTDRFMSNFSLRSTVKQEFKDMLSFLSKENKKVVLSYSTKGLVPVDELEFIFSKTFNHYKLIEKDYKHSTQGKGSININEVLFVAYN